MGNWQFTLELKKSEHQYFGKDFIWYTFIPDSYLEKLSDDDIINAVYRLML